MVAASLNLMPNAAGSGVAGTLPGDDLLPPALMRSVDLGAHWLTVAGLAVILLGMLRFARRRPELEISWALCLIAGALLAGAAVHVWEKTVVNDEVMAVEAAL